MKRKIFIAVIAGTVILMVIGGLWIFREVFHTRTEGEKYGRFDLYIYTTGSDNKPIALTPSLNAQAAVDTPPFVYFEALKNAWFYLLLFTPEKEMTMLFPDPNGYFPAGYRFKPYFLPAGNGWQSYLRSPGEYTLCFIISTRRLQGVERLITRYASFRKTGKPEGAGREITANLQAEIEKYRREQEWIKNSNTIPEWIGGTIRSAEEEVVSRAWSVRFRGIIIHNLSFNYTPGAKHE